MNDTKKNEDKITEEKIKRLKQLSTENPGLTEFANSLGSAIVKPIDKGRIKGLAVQAMEEQTDMQLQQIVEQMEVLASQYKKIKTRSEISYQIYNAEISFTPLIGKEYYLFEKRDGGQILSMISPDEWGESIPYKKYLATVKLMADHTWDILDSDE